jgi:dolichyl-phosphate beta-glucosyltransferase
MFKKDKELNKIALSVVIPCYNEENNIKRGVLDQVFSYLKKQDYNWEVLICNDQSTDNSLQLVKEFSKNHKNFKVLDLPHGGKPSAVWGGIKKAKYPIVLFTDMDQSTPIVEFDKFIPYFKQGADLVIGSRGINRQGFSFIRQIGAPVFLFIRRLVLLANIKDTQCGFKAIKTDLAKKIFPELQFFKDTSNKDGWRVSAFDVELLFMAQKWAYKINEVVVKWQDEDTSSTKGDSNTRYKKESVQMLKEIIRIKKNDIKGAYEQKK